ncbi:MAG: hypothetical protein ABL982_00230, partial [Vicinamibacterales bacterium]
MPRRYTVSFNGTLATASGDIDLLEVLPADDKPVRLLGITLGQISEVADAAEEGVRISVMRMPATVTSGSGGSAPTPVPVDSADAAAGFTAEVGNATVATTSGTALQFLELGWNIRNSPFDYWFPEGLQVLARQGEALIVRLQT